MTSSATKQHRLSAAAEQNRLSAAAEQNRLTAAAEQNRLTAAAEQNRLNAAAEQNRLTAAAEHDRLRALDAYQILDTPDEAAFTALVDSAASLIGTTAAAITLLDANRQWSKAIHGPLLRQSPRAWSMSADVVAANELLVVPDTARDPRYAQLPSNLGGGPVRAYAGMPLIGRDGLPLGDFSVSDLAPRDFTERDLAVLRGLTTAAVALLEQHRSELETGRSAIPPLPVGVDRASFSAAGVRRALQRGEIEVHFQPIVSIPGGRMTGVEALARWNMPGVGLIAPQFFLPHVEASPLLSQGFTEHVLHASCSQLARWRAMGADLRVSVNVSGYDVTGGNLVSMVIAAVQGASIPFDALTLEITETVNLRDQDLAIKHLGQIRDLGVRVTLDDFGVGYSSLEHAGLLPITGLKLDRGFVAGLGNSSAMEATLDSVVLLCRALKLDLVGEGVETQEVAHLLAGAGVELAQGYFFSRPVPFGVINEMIGTNARPGKLVRLPFVSAGEPRQVGSLSA